MANPQIKEEGGTLQDTLPPVVTARLIAPRVAGRALI